MNGIAPIETCRNPDAARARSYSIDDILTSSRDRKLAMDLAEEIETGTSEKRITVEEMRCFLALKGYRELLQRLHAARDGTHGKDALRAVAHAMRRYALVRPALSAAAFRTAAVDCPEWREADGNLHRFMMDVLPAADCTGSLQRTP